MRQDEIRLRLNGRQIEQYRTIGDPPADLVFFEHNRSYFKNEHTVEFRLGDACIVNKVILRGYDVEVCNDYTPIPAESFIELEKQRIAAEKDRARFQDDPRNVFYVSARVILGSRRLPSFNIRKVSRDPGGEKFFVSHRWQQPTHPDPEGEQLALIQEHASKHPNAFYWIDYCSLPQPRLTSDIKLFEENFPMIVSIQSEASTLVLMDDQYEHRLWCFVEHYIGTLFSQTNFGGKRRTIEYAGKPSSGFVDMIAAVQGIREPAWDELLVTKPSDIPFIKLNYQFLTNLVKFQLMDRFVELFRALPGTWLYCARGHYPQSVFALSYPDSLERITALYSKFNWKRGDLYKKDSLNEIAAMLAHSDELQTYSLNDLQFSEYLFCSENSVAYLAMLIALIQEANRSEAGIKNLRTLFARILLMSMFR